MAGGSVTVPELPSGPAFSEETGLGLSAAPQVGLDGIKPPDAFESPWSDPPPPSDSDDPLLGVTLQKTYRITRILGEGGMGRVYEASHTRIDGKRFALKVLHPEYCRQPEVRTRFQREAEAAAAISHPNVVGVYDVAQTEQGWPFLVCEYLEGMDLAGLIKKSGMVTPSLAAHIILQVCDALVAAHNRGVIHRDLKPQNVFLVKSDNAQLTAKVLDFGLSRFTDKSDSSLTKTGMVMGTPSYMAPEQARGERADQLTDVYGVGAMLYAMVTGRPPFHEESPHATLLAVMTYDPPRPHSLNPLVSVHFEMVIQRAMAKKPSERYPKMQALRDAVASLDVGDTSIATGRRAPSSPEVSADEATHARSQLVFYALVAGATLVAAAGTSITGSVYLSLGHWPFSRAEVILSILVVVGTLLTPSVLLVRRLQRTVWGSTVQVLELMQQLRSATLASLVGFGAASLAVRFVYGSILGSPEILAWPGWSVLLVVVAALLGGAAWSRRRFASVQSSTTQRYLLGPGLMAIATLLSGALLYGGGRYQAIAPEGTDAPAAVLSVVPPPLATSASAAHGAAQLAPVEAAPSDTPLDATASSPSSVAPQPPSLTDEQLSSAAAEGLPGLLALAKEFPEDPRLLRALVMEHGSRAVGLAQAMRTLKQLLAIDPSAAMDPDLQLMITNTSGKSPPASTLAYDLLGLNMGTVGTDLLYKLSLIKPAQAPAIGKQLAKPAVQNNLSPALTIALELKHAPSCEARLKLLDRARAAGDDRSARILSGLSASTAKGCGMRRRYPCPAACPGEAAQFQRAMEAIAKRDAAGAR
ncbi:MAG: hypothetical protein RJA70_1503 [Pseudomonadota bacterium]|jgi:serine/threonine-protein kinase